MDKKKNSLELFTILAFTFLGCGMDVSLGKGNLGPPLDNESEGEEVDSNNGNDSPDNQGNNNNGSNDGQSNIEIPCKEHGALYCSDIQNLLDNETTYINDTCNEPVPTVAGLGETLWQRVQNLQTELGLAYYCLLYTSPSPRDATLSRMPSSA